MPRETATQMPQLRLKMPIKKICSLLIGGFSFSSTMATLAGGSDHERSGSIHSPETRFTAGVSILAKFYADGQMRFGRVLKE